MSYMRDFTRGLWDELPPFRMVLGLCPVLAVTKSAEGGLGMGLCVIFVLTLSNIIVSALRRVIPRKVRIASFIVIIATFVVIVELVTQAYFYSIYTTLGLFIPLIVVNCIILGRAEAFASRNGVFRSTLDGLGVGLGFTLSLTVLGSIREILGNGTWFDMPLMWSSFEPFTFMVEAPGAFVCLGLMLGAMNAISGTRAS
ncbi:MAG: RnfABCDGE type electron transport complex subunit E [Candidatus Eisenbacteria bacterium]|nr:RnfABCDGE type electron transport complex subunit E [Candidatus Eisenbacteria bacterium]